MKFPKKENMKITQDRDCGPHVYYSLIMGHFYRWKLALLCNYLPCAGAKRILELGFGSGIALKELSGLAEEVVAIDIHDSMEDVSSMLKKEGIGNVTLFKHDIFKNPLNEKEKFEYVVSSSTLEHIASDCLRGGIQNIHQCLQSDGYFLVGFPLKNVITNFLFKMYEKVYEKCVKGVYSFSLKHDHPSGQDEIIPAIEEYFCIEERKYLFNRFFKLYVVLKCKKIEE